MSVWKKLFVSAHDIRTALSDLGNPASPAEATVFVAAVTLAEMIESSDDCPKVWEMNVAGPPEAVRQAGRAQVEIVCTDAEVDWDEAPDDEGEAA